MNRIFDLFRFPLVFAVFALAACTPAPAPVLPTSASTTPTPISITNTPALQMALPISEEKPELGAYFQGEKGSFVLYDLNIDRFIRYNPAGCAERLIPASTFKIMISLVALETGVIPDENYVIKWNGTHYDVPAWNQDHTLKSAIQYSVVWYYQELASRVGSLKMQHYIDAVGYGNRDISGQIVTFWLVGGLRISADEQVDFLKRLYLNNLPFSQRSMDIVKTILVLDKTASNQLSGKTGSAQINGQQVGWFVGYLETGGKVYFFATNLVSTNPDGMANAAGAKKVNSQILQSLGLMK